MTNLAWQAPTSWSRETKDGIYYIEREAKTRWWRCFRKGKLIGRAYSERLAKAACRKQERIAT